MELESVSECLLCNAAALELIDSTCNITRCANCGYVFDNPRPVFRELVNFYSRASQYDTWLNQLEVRDRMWKRRLKIIVPLRKPGTLLDVGTGIGQFLALARPYFKEVCGTEVSTTAIGIAKEKYSLDLFLDGLEALAQSGKTFDNISLFHVLEHVPNPVAVLRTCHSLLTRNGVLIVAVPNEVVSLRSSLKRKLVAAGILKARPNAGPFGLPRITLTEETSEVHLSHFTPTVLNGLLRSTGFSIAKQTLDPHYVRADAFEKAGADFYYYACLGFRRLFGINVYDAMMVVGRKIEAAEKRPIAA